MFYQSIDLITIILHTLFLANCHGNHLLTCGPIFVVSMLFYIDLVFGSRPSDHYFRSVCWFVCLSVCLCRVFLSRLWSDFDQTRTYVVCLGL